MTTARTTAVTVPQVEALRHEARMAGDWMQRIVCDIALDEHDGGTADDYTSCDGRRDRERLVEILAMTQEQAWAECVRVILEVR